MAQRKQMAGLTLRRRQFGRNGNGVGEAVVGEVGTGVGDKVVGLAVVGLSVVGTLVGLADGAVVGGGTPRHVNSTLNLFDWPGHGSPNTDESAKSKQLCCPTHRKSTTRSVSEAWQAPTP